MEKYIYFNDDLSLWSVFRQQRVDPIHCIEESERYCVMVSVKRIVLDVLKPHQPDALEFSRAIAGTGEGYFVRLMVLEMDERTETLQIEVTGDAIDFDKIQSTISDMGGSLHSIDEVEVRNEPDTG